MATTKIATARISLNRKTCGICTQSRWTRRMYSRSCTCIRPQRDHRHEAMLCSFQRLRRHLCRHLRRLLRPLTNKPLLLCRRRVSAVYSNVRGSDDNADKLLQFKFVTFMVTPDARKLSVEEQSSIQPASHDCTLPCRTHTNTYTHKKKVSTRRRMLPLAVDDAALVLLLQLNAKVHKQLRTHITFAYA